LLQELANRRVLRTVRDGKRNVVRTGDGCQGRGSRRIVGGRDRGQGALPDDHRMHELDCDVGGVSRGCAGAKGDQRPATRERARHRMAGHRDLLLFGSDELGEDPLAFGHEPSKLPR
jgi:hypothetical protein